MHTKAQLSNGNAIQSAIYADATSSQPTESSIGSAQSSALMMQFQTGRRLIQSFPVH